MIQDKIHIGMLNDYYGGILNSHQQEIMRMYFDCDMSLAEIGEFMGVTRQAIREVLVRSTKKLTQMEEKLQLVQKIKVISQRLDSIIEKTADKNIKSELKELSKEIKEI
ncbi:MAG: RNA polymerase subunit sigma-70 [Clostridiales bacterium]|nr:RNA polymerase subunit sigma-70 [Clostridiales bacterium]